ncbi:hypothetical protein CK215_04255 [Mesorhizobium sp. WSM3864]|uniref:helix-turn-helix domain-containing protein n=1 Tax=Mesorhizobium sp. WSM3864 TaxID=2029404 RepID=UPI000BAF17FD|nr:helix-turn-helix domain-containing protein [Mesorhizobium sp. WSM3864]PBB93196.1 hypothetical protein CK215_04255 [Mesorhizobium sp. WSM3864]
MTLDSIYKADEAAERMRVTKRALIKLARKHGACSRVGREYLFSESDLLAIWQAIREPAAGSTFGLNDSTGPLDRHTPEDELKWLVARPPTSVDRRVIGVLRYLDRQTEPLTYNEIQRAGENTILRLLQKNLVKHCGLDCSGSVRVRITPEGREQLKIVERWLQKRAARGLHANNW